MQHSERTFPSLRLIAIIALAALCIAPVTASMDPDQHEHIIIGFQEGSVQSLDVVDLLESDIQFVKELVGLDAVVVSVTDPDRFIEEISQRPGVKFVERDIPVYALDVPAYVPDDPRYAEQWGPKAIGAEHAWGIEQGESSVVIAIIDTGVDYTHPDMGNYITGGYDWINRDNDPMDDHGHGTHCAGIAAATINNSLGVAGISRSGIMAEKVLNYQGSGTSSTTAEAVRHAADSGADIISMSLGATSSSLLLEEACRYAWEKGCILVAASGNNYASSVSYPAAYDTVIAVGSVGKTGERSSFSNYGAKLELMAPGESILSTNISRSTASGLNYCLKTGTSMACPHVSGVAALVLSRYPGMTNQDVRERLIETADDLGSSGKDLYYGYGRVNAFAAVGDGEVIPLTIASEAESIARRENFTLTLTGEGYREYGLFINETGLAGAGTYPQLVPGQQGITAGTNETECRVILPGSGTALVRYTTDFLTVAQPFRITVADPEDPSLSDSITITVNPGLVTMAAGDRDRFFFREEVILSGVNTDSQSTWLYMTGPGLDAGGISLIDTGKTADGMMQVPVSDDGNWSYVWDTGVLEGALENGTYTLYAVSGPRTADELNGVASATVPLELLNSAWPAPSITGISPDIVFVSNNFTTILINGSGFMDGATVLLKKEAYPDVIATKIHGTDANSISAAFDLGMARAGVWEVAVRNADGKAVLLPDALTVRVKGDLNNNGLLDIGDAAFVAYMVVGKAPEDLLADFNGNGAVDIGDAAKIVYYIVDYISEL